MKADTPKFLSSPEIQNRTNKFQQELEDKIIQKFNMKR